MIEVQMVECPKCGMIQPAGTLLKDWDGFVYTFACCGTKSDLGPGGARNWLEESPFDQEAS